MTTEYHRGGDHSDHLVMDRGTWAAFRDTFAAQPEQWPITQTPQWLGTPVYIDRCPCDATKEHP